MTATTAVSADQLVEMLEILDNRNDPSRLHALAAPDLRHYSSAIGDGVQAWAAYAAAFGEASPLVAVHCTVAEGNRIGIHAHYRWNVNRMIDDGPGVAGKVKVNEHWDVLQADFTSPGGHTFPG
ncbi:MAG: hypothetical protein K0U84_23945 [Actinomycetia bacterium]|nr:hypothetical protein [Actinomycetes bacterium]